MKKEETRARSQPVTAQTSLANAGSEPSAAIMAFLDRAQARDLKKDEGHGYRFTRDVALAVGMEKTACRDLLEQMAADGLIRRVQFTNALSWRSITPLPWEVVKVPSTAPFTLIVQACWGDRVRDVKLYRSDEREQAGAHVRLENWQAEARRKDDYWNDRHLGGGYTAPPTYRLVSLVTVDDPKAALAKAEGRS